MMSPLVIILIYLIYLLFLVVVGKDAYKRYLIANKKIADRRFFIGEIVSIITLFLLLTILSFLCLYINYTGFNITV